jgi:hypothetical protein
VGLDMMKLLAAHMPAERVLAIAGEDLAWTFLTVQPELFSGRINVRPSPESGVLESRQDRQQRITALVTELGLPPDQALKALNYPDLNRLLRPGGEAYSLAQRENVEMLQSGMPALVWPEQLHDVHIPLHIQAMQGSTFREAPPQAQQAMRIHLQMHKAAFAQQQVEQVQMAAPAVLAQAELGQQAAPPEEQQPQKPRLVK